MVYVTNITNYSPLMTIDLILRHIWPIRLEQTNSTGLNVHEPFPFVWTKPVFRS